MSIKAFIFDLDGTLLDTIDDIANSMNKVLAESGFPVHPVESYKKFVGDGMETLVKRVLPEGKRDANTIQNCLARMREIYGIHQYDNTRPYSGITELLNEIQKRGLKLAVLSNKPDKNTKEIVKQYFPEIRFSSVHGQRQGFEKKPSPKGAVAIAQELGIDPSEFLYVGDTNTDMLTAAAAGMYPVGVLWGFREADELSANGAKVLISNPLELLKLLR